MPNLSGTWKFARPVGDQALSSRAVPRVSNGSQFYVCLSAMPSFDGQYTVFGRVIWGLDTLDLISTKSVDSNDNPVDRIEIRSVKVMPREKLPAPPAPEKPGAAVPKADKKPWWKIFG